MKTHEFHLVNPSPWPFLGAMATCILCFGAVFFFHDISIGKLIMAGGFGLVLLTMFLWWRDVIKEAAIDKEHTGPVQRGLRMGMSLFILSEVMFFFAFFFAFFHSAIFPTEILGEDGVWAIKEGIWPPEGVKTLNAWDIPFLNTLILLLSGTTVTWAHYSLLNNNRKDLVKALGLTVFLGFVFTGFQIYEYSHALHHNFGFDDNIYSANFYMATGFHGFHVMVGTLFLLVCFFRARKGEFSEKHHLGFEFAAWYWHFVDVVWLFLFGAVYIWGA
jgi:cytochrome c oxidase subunit 3